MGTLAIAKNKIPDPHPPSVPSSPQEFNAHQSAVNCLKIGRKSSGVMVTGGDDKKVNLWSIGKSTPILSLAGHQSAVECVTLDVIGRATVHADGAKAARISHELKILRDLERQLPGG